MVSARLAQSNLPGEAQLGSILAAPFEDDQFDHVFAIGCLHHTGDLQKAIEGCRRLLKPGGTLILMVYYAFSYRRFMSSRATTLRYMFRELFGYRGVIGSSAEAERAAYDSGSDGTGAPHTDWVSSRSLRYFCRHLKDYASFPDNIGQAPPFSDRTRAQLVLTPWSRWFGLDLYAVATK